MKRPSFEDVLLFVFVIGFYGCTLVGAITVCGVLGRAAERWVR